MARSKQSFHCTSGRTRRAFLAASARQLGWLAVPACVLGSKPSISWAADEPLDLVIANAWLVDGTGADRVRADVGLRGDRIESIGKLKKRAAARRIDAKNLVVAPGFIDIHTHSDTSLLTDGSAKSALFQGVTTQVIGNCGGSPAPVRAASNAGQHEFATYADYVRALSQAGLSINVCGLVGHNTLRTAVMGVENRRPTEDEMRHMRDHVAEAMRAGAVGMSTGLVSPPGAYSETDEIVELARVVAEHHGLYASHIRGEASTLVESVQEALDIGRLAGPRVEISHHKAAGKENWGKTRVTLLMIDEVERGGQTVHVDVYPYRAGSAGLSQLVPPWAHEGGTSELLERLRDPNSRVRIAREMTVGAANWPNFFRIDWNDIQITSVKTDANRRWVGKRVADVAKDRQCTGVQACIDLLLEEEAQIGMVNFIMDEEEMRLVLQHRLSIVGSDGSALSAEAAVGQPHPRTYGCFARVLGQYVRELDLISLETAIHKMTSMPAAQLGLAGRGILKAGAHADLVVFDPATIIDHATFDQPHQYASGVSTVIVNGKLVIDEGKHLGTQAGRVLPPEHSA